MTVTVADADFEGSSTLVAVIVAAPASTGAVHVTDDPDPANVPAEADHVTDPSEAFDTEAVMLRSSAAPTVADAGDTVTLTSWGSVPPSPPHAAMIRRRTPTRIERGVVEKPSIDKEGTWGSGVRSLVAVTGTRKNDAGGIISTRPWTDAPVDLALRLTPRGDSLEDSPPPRTMPSKSLPERFSEALDLDDEARAAYLLRLEAQDPEAATDLRSLLAAHVSAPGFLDDGVEPVLRSFFSTDLGAGTRVGPYRIERPLGSGGMGVVCLARRVDDFDHLVAIKFARWGVDDEQLRRLVAERDILARLRHPGIAQLYGGGVHAGHPYLVMEYVEGTPITTHCVSEDVDVRTRIDLIREVCEAVQYAHRNLVIHRDLKPSNIFVSADGTVKLLDFGVAKLIQDHDGRVEGEAPTSAGFTPGYGSPEQTRREAVTTSADVFAIGVLAYELLSGTQPFRTGRASPREMEAALMDEDPPPPSRSAGPSASRTIPPDLDNIVLKAMRKRPTDRYESAAALSEDLDRFSRGLPVRANKPTLRYVAAKFVHRHRLSVAAAAVAVLSLLGGLGAALGQANIANRRATEAALALDRAEAATARAQRVNAFLQGVLATANPSWYVQADVKGPDATVLDALREAAGRMDAELIDDPEVRADIHHTLGDTYRALYEHDLMVHHFERSLALRRETFDPPHPKIAEAMYYMAAAVSRAGSWAPSYQMLDEGIEMLRARDEGNNLPYMLQAKASFERRAGRMDQAVRLYAEAYDDARERFPAGHRYHSTVQAGASELLRSFVLAGRLPEARRLLDTGAGAGSVSWAGGAALLHAAEGSLATAEREYRVALTDGADVARLRFELATAALIPLDRWSEAESALLEAVADWEREAPGRPVAAQEALLAHAALAYVRAAAGQPHEDEARLADARRRYEALVQPPDRPYFWIVDAYLAAAEARLLVAEGDPERGRALLRATATALPWPDSPHPAARTVLSELEVHARPLAAGTR